MNNSRKFKGRKHSLFHALIFISFWSSEYFYDIQINLISIYQTKCFLDISTTIWHSFKCTKQSQILQPFLALSNNMQLFFCIKQSVAFSLEIMFIPGCITYFAKTKSMFCFETTSKYDKKNYWQSQGCPKYQMDLVRAQYSVGLGVNQYIKYFW